MNLKDLMLRHSFSEIEEVLINVLHASLEDIYLFSRMWKQLIKKETKPFDSTAFFQEEALLYEGEELFIHINKNIYEEEYFEADVFATFTKDNPSNSPSATYLYKQDFIEKWKYNKNIKTYKKNRQKKTYEEKIHKDEKSSNAVRYGLTFIPWNEILGLTIAPETLNAWSEPEIIAFCLEEMSFINYEEEARERTFQELLNLKEEINKNLDRKQENHEFEDTVLNGYLERIDLVAQLEKPEVLQEFQKISREEKDLSQKFHADKILRDYRWRHYVLTHPKLKGWLDKNIVGYQLFDEEKLEQLLRGFLKQYTYIQIQRSERRKRK